MCFHKQLSRTGRRATMSDLRGIELQGMKLCNFEVQVLFCLKNEAFYGNPSVGAQVVQTKSPFSRI